MYMSFEKNVVFISTYSFIITRPQTVASVIRTRTYVYL